MRGGRSHGDGAGGSSPAPATGSTAYGGAPSPLRTSGAGAAFQPNRRRRPECSDGAVVLGFLAASPAVRARQRGAVLAELRFTAGAWWSETRPRTAPRQELPMRHDA